MLGKQWMNALTISILKLEDNLILRTKGEEVKKLINNYTCSASKKPNLQQNCHKAINLSGECQKKLSKLKNLENAQKTLNML